MFRVLIGAVFGAVIYMLFLTAPSFERLERNLDRSYEHMAIVRDFLAEQEGYSRIVLRERSMFRSHYGVMGGSSSAPVEDEDVIAAMNTLRRRGFRYIERRYYGILFRRWNSLTDWGRSRGIVYIMEDDWVNISRRYLYIMEIEPLARERWYAIEASFPKYHRNIDIAREAFFADPSLDWIEDELESNLQDFLTIISFMLAVGNDSFSSHIWGVNRGEIRVGEDNVSIYDDVLEAYRSLMSQGYFSISKKDNVIYFKKECAWRGFEYGILYAVDGALPEGYHPPRYTVMLAASSRDGWYFYVSDLHAYWEPIVAAMDAARAEFFAEPNIDFITERFYSDREYIFAARDFLMAQEYPSITISTIYRYAPDYESQMTIHRTGVEGTWESVIVPIENEEVLAVFNSLIFDKGYGDVRKSNNHIVFRRYNRDLGWNFSYGFAYSTDIDEPHPFGGYRILSRRVLLEPASEENWYFFVDDSAEWNRRNTSRSLLWWR